MASEITVPTKHERLLAWVEEVAALDQARPGPLVRRLRRRVRPPLPGARRRRDLRAPVRRQAPELLPRALRSRRRRPRRGPHVHLLASARTTPARRTTGATRDEMRETLDGPVPRLHAGPHDVRRAVQHGPARLADHRDRRRDHRLGLRRGVDADHDPHGRARSSTTLGDDGDFVPCLHSVGAPLAAGEEDVPWPNNAEQQVHRPLPRDARDLVVRLGLRRQRAARQEVLRAADRVGHGARRGLDGRAHADPQADLARGRDKVHHRRVPERVRQDQPGDARSRRSRAGRSRRSATTSRG